jgi:hypothetical protein
MACISYKRSLGLVAGWTDAACHVTVAGTSRTEEEAADSGLGEAAQGSIEEGKHSKAHTGARGCAVSWPMQRVSV